MDELYSDKGEDIQTAPPSGKTSWDQILSNNFTQAEIGNDAEQLFQQIALFKDTFTEEGEPQGTIEIVDLESDDLVQCSFVDLAGNDPIQMIVESGDPKSTAGGTNRNLNIKVFDSDKDSSVEEEIARVTMMANVEKPKNKKKSVRQKRFPKRQRKCSFKQVREGQQNRSKSFRIESDAGAEFVKIKRQAKRIKLMNVAKRVVHFADEGEQA